MKKPKEFKMQYGTVSLPMPLIDNIKKKIEGTGINSVSAYVTFVLRQIFSSSPVKEEILDKKSEEEIKERLSNLGYL